MGRRGSDWKEGTVIGKEGDSDGRRGHRWGGGDREERGENDR